MIGTTDVFQCEQTSGRDRLKNKKVATKMTILLGLRTTVLWMAGWPAVDLIALDKNPGVRPPTAIGKVLRQLSATCVLTVSAVKGDAQEDCGIDQLKRCHNPVLHYRPFNLRPFIPIRIKNH